MRRCVAPATFVVLLVLASGKSFRSNSAVPVPTAVQSKPPHHVPAILLHVKRSSHPVEGSTEQNFGSEAHLNSPRSQQPTREPTKQPSAARIVALQDSETKALGLDDDGWGSDDETGEEVVKQVDKTGIVLHKTVIQTATEVADNQGLAEQPHH